MKELYLIDSHCHLESPEYADKISEIVDNANKQNIKKIVCIGTDLESSIKAIELTKKFECIYAIIGIFPEYIDDIKDLPKIKELARNNSKVIGIGEIGFDFHQYKKEDVYEQQKDLFIRQLEIADELNLPVSIHSRDAYEETLEVIKAKKPHKIGVFHCFSYSYEFYKEIAKLGFLVGFDGPITFKNATSLRETVSKIPLTSIVLETDSPYLTPEPLRGKLNEPANLIHIANKLAEIKLISIDKVVEETTNNFNKVFFNGK